MRSRRKETAADFFYFKTVKNHPRSRFNFALRFIYYRENSLLAVVNEVLICKLVISANSTFFIKNQLFPKKILNEFLSVALATYRLTSN